MTESGNQDLTSDLIVWSATFSHKSMKIRDAQVHAQSIAENAGAAIGNLKNQI